MRESSDVRTMVPCRRESWGSRADVGGCGGPPECELEPDPGDCDAVFTKYYYDPAIGDCMEFTYGGCGGVAPFDSMLECQAECVN